MTVYRKVYGRRSPRWALWSRLTIPCQDGLLYLARLRIVQTPWFGIYLHDIYEPDTDQDPHDHPWTFWSVVLRGHYTERLHHVPHVHRDLDVSRERHGRWSIHRMPRDKAHRIVEAGPGLKTLIVTGPRRRTWGFYTDAGWVPWQEYQRERGEIR